MKILPFASSYGGRGKDEASIDYNTIGHHTKACTSSCRNWLCGITCTDLELSSTNHEQHILQINTRIISQIGQDPKLIRLNNQVSVLPIDWMLVLCCWVGFLFNFIISISLGWHIQQEANVAALYIKCSLRSDVFSLPVTVQAYSYRNYHGQSSINYFPCVQHFSALNSFKWPLFLKHSVVLY